jgi:hypothetical protein
VADKPRYRGHYEGDNLYLSGIQETVTAAQRAGGTRYKPRVRGQFEGGQLRIRPTVPSPAGRLSDVENDVLRTLGNQERGGQVPLTYFPTVSSNPADPRTAAAGYDPATKTLRVEWGDGGRAYNYYQVQPSTWIQFQNPQKTPSPGRYINRILNDHPYGPA